MSVRAKHSSVHPLSVVALVLAAGACAVDLDAPSAEPSTTSTPQAIGAGCSIIICTENAATAGDGLLFDELDLFGRPNYAGVALIGANLPDGTPVRIQIFGDELWAYATSTSTWYSGTQLLMTEIHFVYQPTGEIFDIRLEDYMPQSVFFMTGLREPIPAYDFKARRAGGNFDFHICSNDTLPLDPTWSGLPHHAILFRGDRYEPGRKALKANNPGDGWSFLACNGGAATKMHLWRHTYAGAFDALGNARYMTTLDERTALLKAITDDFCGTGTPTWTVTGTKIAFATAKDPLAFPFPYLAVGSIEAMWGPAGALCIDRPRRQPWGITKSLVEAKCGRTFPQCAPPGATSPPAGWYSTHYALTGNP